MPTGVLFLLRFAYDQYCKLLEAFIYRIFNLPLHRSMETVREVIASKSGNPKVRQHEEDLDSIVPFIMDKIGSSLILCFSHVVGNSTLFYGCPT